MPDDQPIMTHLNPCTVRVTVCLWSASHYCYGGQCKCRQINRFCSNFIVKIGL